MAPLRGDGSRVPARPRRGACPAALPRPLSSTPPAARGDGRTTEGRQAARATQSAMGVERTFIAEGHGPTGSGPRPSGVPESITLAHGGSLSDGARTRPGQRAPNQRAQQSGAAPPPGSECGGKETSSCMNARPSRAGGDGGRTSRRAGRLGREGAPSQVRSAEGEEGRPGVRTPAGLLVSAPPGAGGARTWLGPGARRATSGFELCVS